MSTKRQYVYHRGTDTMIALDECEIIELDDATANAVLDGEKEAPCGMKADDPFAVISFSAAAIREHFENHDEAEKVEGLSDDDLAEAGEWAMNAGFLWDSVYAAMSYGVEQVRDEREAGHGEPV